MRSKGSSKLNNGPIPTIVCLPNPSPVAKRKGKEKKVYNVYRTPYEALRGLPGTKNFLKNDGTFEKLDTLAKKQSDNEFAALMQKAKEELFNNFNRHKLQLPTFYTTIISGSYVD